MISHAPSVAWEGPVSMAEAKWTDKDGSLVRLKLLAVNEEQRNPFVKFTKRKGGKAGTRFQAAVVEQEPPHRPIYTDEAMLAGWNDSQNGGMSVTLWLAHDRMGHPFEGVSRKTALQLVLVELDDDQQEIDQRARDRLETAQSRAKSPSERPSYAAAMLCKNPDFRKWVQVEFAIGTWMPDPRLGDEEWSAKWLREFLNVESRGELDRNAAALDSFKREIQYPFSRWLSLRTKPASASFDAPSPATHQ